MNPISNQILYFMSHRKKGASHYDKAVTRLAALKSIDEKMDLRNGLSISIYEDLLLEFRSKLDDYNTGLSNIDEKLTIVLAFEKILRDYSERILTGVAARFGKDSNEYKKAGGVKKSERRKKSPNKKKEAA